MRTKPGLSWLTVTPLRPQSFPMASLKPTSAVPIATTLPGRTRLTNALARRFASLQSVPIDRWGGCLFINPDPQCGPLRDALGVPNVSLVFLVAVLVVAVRLGLWPSIYASLVCFLTYNFLYTEPYYTFEVKHEEDLLTILFFLVVALA